MTARTRSWHEQVIELAAAGSDGPTARATLIAAVRHNLRLLSAD